jgi:glycosyltransferase involved in cell wall biosynthesis
MNIAVINPRFHPPFGGATAVCFYIVEALQEEGHDIKYYSGADRSVDDVNERFGLSIDLDLDMNVVGSPLSYRVLDRSGRGVVLKRCIEDRFFLDLAKSIEEDFDLIVLGRHVFHADIEFEKTVLQYVHDHLPGGLDKPEFYRRVYSHFSEPRLFANADLNLYNSEYISSKNPQRGKTVYPPVDSEFNPNRDREDRAVILGRIAEDKNMDEAVEIISETDLDLTIVGSADEGSEYVEQLEKRIGNEDWASIRKNVPRDELRELLETSEIGLSCKREENFGINVVEYMKAGLLPMVYNHAGPAEIVESKRFTYESIEEAAKKIEDNIEDESCRKTVLSRSKDFGADKFKKEFISSVEEIS